MDEFLSVRRANIGVVGNEFREKLRPNRRVKMGRDGLILQYTGHGNDWILRDSPRLRQLLSRDVCDAAQPFTPGRRGITLRPFPFGSEKITGTGGSIGIGVGAYRNEQFFHEGIFPGHDDPPPRGCSCRFETEYGLY